MIQPYLIGFDESLSKSLPLFVDHNISLSNYFVQRESPEILEQQSSCASNSEPSTSPKPEELQTVTPTLDRPPAVRSKLELLKNTAEPVWRPPAGLKFSIANTTRL